MLRIGRENEIELTRGDTAYLTVPITDEATGEAYIMDAADVLTLTVKRTALDAAAYIQKTVTGANVFHIDPMDTANMDFGRYRYDVQLTRANGDVHTVIAPTVFRVCEEVTY